MEMIQTIEFWVGLLLGGLLIYLIMSAWFLRKLQEIRAPLREAMLLLEVVKNNQHDADGEHASDDNGIPNLLRRQAE